MESGWKFGPNSYENEEIDGVTKAKLADERTESPISTSKTNTVVQTTGKSKDNLAMEKKIGSKLYVDMVKAELRVQLLKNLTNLGVGTNRIEENQIKSRKELVRDTGRRIADIKQEMERKI